MLWWWSYCNCWILECAWTHVSLICSLFVCIWIGEGFWSMNCDGEFLRLGCISLSYQSVLVIQTVYSRTHLYAIQSGINEIYKFAKTLMRTCSACRSEVCPINHKKLIQTSFSCGPKGLSADHWWAQSKV